MPESWIGDSGGTMRKITDVMVGDSAGTKRNVQEMWVGNSSGVPKLVWQRSVAMSMTATATDWDRIQLTWSVVSGATKYVVKRGSTQIYSGMLLAKVDTGLSASTKYNYTVTAYNGTVIIGTGADSATTQAKSLITKEVTLAASASASYNQAGANRNVAECYCGYYSSNYGNQKSLWSFNNIPADLRNCYAIDQVKISVYCLHHYFSSGGQFGVVVHHGSQTLNGFPATYPGSTSVFGYYPAPKPGYLNNAEWIDVTSALCPGRTTVKEEFRINGAVGFGLAAATSSNTYYGYAAGNGQANEPRVYFKYRVYES